jgi:hypothetical protein
MGKCLPKTAEGVIVVDNLTDLRKSLLKIEHKGGDITE